MTDHNWLDEHRMRQVHELHFDDSDQHVVEMMNQAQGQTQPQNFASQELHLVLNLTQNWNCEYCNSTEPWYTHVGICLESWTKNFFNRLAQEKAKQINLITLKSEAMQAQELSKHSGILQFQLNLSQSLEKLSGRNMRLSGVSDSQLSS